MRRARPLFVPAALGLLVACGGTNVGVEFTFPDADSRALTTALQITAVEPFIPAPSESGRSRVLLKCGELGVFGPTVKVNRDQSDLPNLNVLVQREGRDFPLDGDWNLELERFKSSEETNPWRAVLVHVEARGNARKSEGGLATTDEVKTLLEGCYCMRLNESATYAADPKLDEEVKAACPALVDSTPRPVVLAPVLNDKFSLTPCGVQAVTAPRGRQAVALPGVCVRTNTCKDSPGGNCFPCATDQCTELDDLKNVPVRVEVEQAAGQSVADPKVILTNRFGTVTPQAQVDDCASPIKLKASIVGSAAPPIEFPVDCVDPVDFAARPTDEFQLGGVASTTQIAAITTIPEERTASGALRSRARVAVLVNQGSATLLQVFESNGNSLVRTASLAFPPGGGAPERGFGLLGYHYKLAAKQAPMLAVVTSRMGTPVIRIYALDPDTGELGPPIRQTDQRCTFDACASIRECAASRPCDEGLELGSTMPPLSMAVADRNNDGLADVTVATDREFQVLTYYSHPSFPDIPPPLEQTCQCSAFGRGMPALDFVQLGGPQSGGDPTGRNVDMLMGDGTGAYVRYAQEARVEGQPCSLTASVAALPCPAGLQCRELCPGEGAAASARCVEPCVYEDPDSCKTSADRPECVTFERIDGVQPTGPGFCGAPSLGCRAPSSVWRLVTIHDVAKARIRSEAFEDAIAVGAGSPVPSSSGGGLLRILYGGSVDLTNVSSLPAGVRNESSVDLGARRLLGTEEAQSPRGVEVGDINGDGLDDIAAIYTSSEEIRVWLGGGNAVPGELGRSRSTPEEGGRIRLNQCGASCPGRERCFPFQRFAVADLDADGLAEVLAICVPDQDGPKPVLKWFKPQPG
jgi:hypothetical protein